MEGKERVYVKVDGESVEGRVSDYISCNIKFRPLRVTVQFGAKFLECVVELVKKMRIQR